jgi:hypothetical protein
MLIGKINPDAAVRTPRFWTVIVGAGDWAPASLLMPSEKIIERPTKIESMNKKHNLVVMLRAGVMFVL